MLTQEQQRFLLKVARESIETSILDKTFNLPVISDEIFIEKKGAFVTLHKNNMLRGCIGYIKAYKPLLQTIIEMARAAAFEDHRFPPLQFDELSDIRIEISILSDLTPVKNNNLEDIQVGRDGIFLEYGFHSGLLLPQVATENNWNRKTFLEQTCHKAGLYKDSYLNPECRIFRFSADIFSENSEKY